jgi:hypothetical protein
MIIYIAGPMTGIDQFNYPAFNAAATHLQARGHDVLNPVDSEKHNDSGSPQTWDWYMRHAIRMLLTADSVALLPGWERSRGARLEFHLSTELHLDVRPLESWMRTS